MKCRAVQSVTKRCKELQNNEMQSSTIRYKAMQIVAKQRNAEQYNPLQSDAKSCKTQQYEVLQISPEQVVEDGSDSRPMLQHHEGDLGRDLLSQLLLGSLITRIAEDLHVALSLGFRNNTPERSTDNAFDLLLLRNRSM